MIEIKSMSVVVRLSLFLAVAFGQCRCFEMIFVFYGRSHLKYMGSDRQVLGALIRTNLATDGAMQVASIGTVIF